jgi:diphthine synthase
MLWLIGLGIHGIRGIGLNSLDVLKNCDIVYVERYTSSISDLELDELNGLICTDGKKHTILIHRWFLEDGREILENAKDKEIALLTYGDPLIATTHAELHIRAVKNSISVKVIHAASGISSLVGETGLHVYKFGRTVTITSEPQSVISVYSTIFDNLILGNHTMILTEYNDRDGQAFFLNPADALKALLESERDLKNKACHEETFAIIVSRIGTKHQTMISGKIRSLINLDYGLGPHTLIVTGFLHFAEVDALTTLTKIVDKPSDNTLLVQNKSANMVEKYVPKAKNAIMKIRTALNNEFNPTDRNRLDEIVENAGYYIEDAIRFLRTGRPELAVLSIGYAEGLLDAIGITEHFGLWD